MKPGTSGAPQPWLEFPLRNRCMGTMKEKMKDDTYLVHSAHDSEGHAGIVNIPPYRASTVIYPDLASYNSRFDGDARYDGFSYAARGTPTGFALADAVANLEGGHKAVATATGLSAVTIAIGAFISAGHHILVTDSAYGPTRKFCNNVLARFGVETTYYDPLIGADIAGLMRENTKVVFTESPGSMSFEMQDIPAIAAAAHAEGAVVLMDNTWATPLYFKAFEHGVDVSIHAGTKYIGGHSDLMLGVVTARNEEMIRKIKDQAHTLGDVAGPDECYLALRGLRTLGARLRQQQDSALRVARWLAERPEVGRVLHPALPGDPGHAIWKRDFLGASSLFGLLLRTSDDAAVERMVEALRLFMIGSSWGGYESLISLNPLEGLRTAVPWTESPHLLRLHIGLEDPGDLIADLEQALGKLSG